MALSSLHSKNSSRSVFQAVFPLLFHRLGTVHFGLVQYEIPRGVACQPSASDQSKQWWLKFLQRPSDMLLVCVSSYSVTMQTHLSRQLKRERESVSHMSKLTQSIRQCWGGEGDKNFNAPDAKRKWADAKSKGNQIKGEKKHDTIQYNSFTIWGENNLRWKLWQRW